MKAFTGISLFSGAGGMDVGFENAGVKIILANEIMPEAAATYNANHQNGVMIQGDINNIMDMFNDLHNVDIVFGVSCVDITGFDVCAFVA